MGTRRQYLKLASLAGAGFGMAKLDLLSAHAAELNPVQSFTAQALRGDTFLISGVNGNILGLSGAEGLLLVGGVKSGSTPEFLNVLDAYTQNSAVKTLYNTDWHNAGANEALSARGAHIIAHENTRLWLGNDFFVDWQNRQYSPRPASALPNETFYETHHLSFADETIESRLMFQAHTDGDIVVYLRSHNILAVGDLMADGIFPIVDPVTGGWIGAQVKAQAQLLAMIDDDTLIIPATGRVQNKADLLAQHAMLDEMKTRINDMVRQGKGPQEMLDAGIADGFEQWGDPTRFILNAYPGLGRHYRELDGVV